MLHLRVQTGDLWMNVGGKIELREGSDFDSVNTTDDSDSERVRRDCSVRLG